MEYRQQSLQFLGNNRWDNNHEKSEKKRRLYEEQEFQLQSRMREEKRRQQVEWMQLQIDQASFFGQPKEQMNQGSWEQLPEEEEVILLDPLSSAKATVDSLNVEQLLQMKEYINEQIKKKMDKRNYFSKSSLNPFYEQQKRDPEQVKSIKKILSKRLKGSVSDAAGMKQFLEQDNHSINQIDQFTKSMGLSNEEKQAYNEIKNDLVRLNKAEDLNIEQIVFLGDVIAVNEQALSVEEITSFQNASKAQYQVLKKQVENLAGNSSKPIKDCASVALLGLHSIYKQQGHQLFLKDNDANSAQAPSDDDPIYKYQKSIIQTGQTTGLGYFKIYAEYNCFDVDDKKCVFQSNRINQEIASQCLKKELSQEYGIQPGQVVVIDLAISKENKAIAASIRLPEDITQKIVQSKSSSLPDKPSNIKKHFHSVYIEFASLIKHFQLSEDLFDQEFNMEWPSSKYKNNEEYRGALQFANGYVQKQRYHMPLDWQGFGLNVKNWRESDKSKWFSQDSGIDTWIVLFHGTKGDFLKSILDSGKSINPGVNNLYGNWTCRITKQKIESGPNENTYLTDDVNVAETYSDQKGHLIGGKKFKFVFQCRVNPTHVKSPESMSSYYVVNKLFQKENIRPYRLLVKQVQ